MSIRSRLSLLFTGIVASIILIAFIIILVISSNYRKTEFDGRLEEKASHTARLLFDVDEVDSTLLMKIDGPGSGSLIDERLTIMTTDRQILFSTDQNNDLGITDEQIGELSQDTLIRFENGNLEVLGLRYISAEKPYYIFVGGYDKFGIRKITNLQLTLFVTWVFCVVIFAYAGWVFSGRVLHPVAKITSEVDQINTKNLETRINEGNGKDELARLAKTFNSMLDRLETSIKHEKTFLTNASHELRNPLAAITSQLEVCLLSERNSVEYQTTLRSVLEDIKTLNKLSHQLLLLMRLEAGFITIQLDSERIDQLIFDACEPEMRSQTNFEIDFQFRQEINDENQWKLSCSRELLISAFHNIVENAKKFGAKTLVIEHRVVNQNHQLLFTDDGPGIEHFKDKKVFELFFRGDNTKERQGHGVGLSLVYRIIQFHKGNVEVVSSSNKGTTFMITLPGYNGSANG